MSTGFDLSSSERIPARVLQKRAGGNQNLPSKFRIVLSFFMLVGWSCLPVYGSSAIEFTQVPPKNPGGPLTMAVITGRVNVPHEGLKLVLYARSGRDRKWYVQPYFHQPFTTIQPDSTWNSGTHLGTEYAAFLVQADYVPPSVTEILPSPGGRVIAAAITPGTPPVWEKLWFQLWVVSAAVLSALALYRWRIWKMTRQLNVRFEERLAERTRIAKEIHDTLLQGFLSASMQLHIVADQLPEGSSQREPLAHILKLMGKVVDEGRNAIRGLRPLSVNQHDLEDVFSRLPEELAASQQADLRIIVEGQSRTLHPVIRDEVYRIGRQAIANAFRLSADSVEVELEYAENELRIAIRDNGRGIDQQLLKAGSEDQFGLSGMHDRAHSIGAKLKVWSRASGGTEVGLAVPGRIAFQSETPGSLSKWLSRKISARNGFE